MNKVKVIAAVTAAAAASAAFTCYLLAPHRSDPSRIQQWNMISRYRYAHRGLHDNATGAPENSLAAFAAARAAGFGSELDVHLTADKTLAVVHDSWLTRATGADLKVEDLTRADLDQLRLFGSDQTIPTLGQVLDLYAPGPGVPPLIVEIKTNVTNVAELTAATMAELDRHRTRACVESFDPRVLVWLRRHRPEVIRGQLSYDFVHDPDSPWPLPAKLALTNMLGNVATRPDFVAYRFSDRTLVAPRLAKRLGAAQVSWTITSAEDLNQAESEGRVGIFEGFMPNPA